jgi:hypothetical protein
MRAFPSITCGDFFREERSEWDPETLLEEPYDVERACAALQRPMPADRAHIPVDSLAPAYP